MLSAFKAAALPGRQAIQLRSQQVQITESFELPCPPTDVWPILHDITLLVDCLPGASLDGPIEAGMTPLRFEVKLGPIVAAFVGKGQASFDEARSTGRFEGTAIDRRTSSRVKGCAEFALGACAAGSSIEVNVDYALSGALAQFSRAGIVRELAALLTEQFAFNLSQRLQPQHTLQTLTPAMQVGDDDAACASAQPAALADPTAPAPVALAFQAAAPLSMGVLLRKLLRARWMRFVGWLRTR
jgi:carbon monoxide dehydrogenase subunit G